MAQIVYSANALDNLERAFRTLARDAPSAAVAAAHAIRSAVEMLAFHPMVGRIVVGELRELVISYGKTGYVALYRYLPNTEEVRVLAIKHQRELDYP
ncbi:MAG TPA: type II toxin-antitoxin system RelE/ParE family toxin [Kofleriaceae bacterium]|jgi:plasmid stabilization system protein ParE